MKGLAIALGGTFALTAMIFTLPDIIGLELTVAMMATLSVLMGMYVILITEIIHRTSLALIGALIIIIVLLKSAVGCISSGLEGHVFVYGSLPLRSAIPTATRRRAY